MNFVDVYDYDNVKHTNVLNQFEINNFYKKIDFYHKRVDALIAFTSVDRNIENDKFRIETKVIEEIKKIDFVELTAKLFQDRETIIKENSDLKKKLDLLEKEQTVLSNQGIKLVALLEEILDENVHDKLPENIKEDGDDYYKFKNQQWVKLEDKEIYLVHSKLFTKIKSDLWSKKPFVKKSEIVDEVPF